MKTPEQWQREIATPPLQLEAIRQIQADALRWAVEQIRWNATLVGFRNIIDKANQLDPQPWMHTSNRHG